MTGGTILWRASDPSSGPAAREVSQWQILLPPVQFRHSFFLPENSAAGDPAETFPSGRRSIPEVQELSLMRGQEDPCSRSSPSKRTASH